uniref:Craniofacial development protein 2 n=3 Tax=Cacopsylla melanoneura TaxID=428564 RepID=A0A8D8YAF2_9HEMI
MIESSRVKYSGGKIAFHSDLRVKVTRGVSNMSGTRRQKEGEVSVRIGSLNVGSMTGRGRELVDVMQRRRLSVLCVQETRWSGNKAVELGEGYKLFYSSANSSQRNGVGIILDRELKEEVCEVDRVNDRVISMKIMIGNEICRVISVYVPQVGCADSEKEDFWVVLDDLVMSAPSTKRIFLCGDLNGHVGGRENDEYMVHGGYGYGMRNDEGSMIVEHAKAYDLRILNTFFKKKDENYITYKSGGNVSQIDYVLCRSKHGKEVRDCNVIKGESVTTQHRLVVIDVDIKSGVVTKYKKTYEKRVKWWKLKEESVRREFKEKVLEKISREEDVETWWTVNSEIIKRVGVKVMGMTSGKGAPENKESWWWNEEVQGMVKLKKVAWKKWDISGREEDRLEYQRAKKNAKRAVAVAKAKAIEEGYRDIENGEGERRLLRIAKAKDRESKDVTVIKQIKDKEGNVLQDHNHIKERWREYFEGLLNEENLRDIFESGVENLGVVKEVSREEIEKALKKMKNGKAVGVDGIPVEVWKCLGEEGIDILWDLMMKCMDQERIPNEWRKSVMVPIFKGKGDVQQCGNYRGIKLMSHSLKIWERIVENRLREETSISEEQFGFMPGRGTSDAVFAMRRLMERCREMQRELHAAFIDLEKAYDRVPRG